MKHQSPLSISTRNSTVPALKYFASRAIRTAASQISSRIAYVERNSWRHFDNFLMAALNRAVALIEMEDVPVMISKDLNLDVLGPPDKALEKNRIISKRCRCLLPCFCDLCFKFAFDSNDPHPTPPSAKRCLNNQRKSNLGGYSPGHCWVCHRLFGSGDYRHAGLLGEAPRSRLIAEQFQKIG